MAINYSYSNISSLGLDDRLLVVDVSESNATKLASISNIVNVAKANISLQDVLDVNNTATQDINLTGEINTTDVITTSLIVGGISEFNGAASFNGLTTLQNVSIINGNAILESLRVINNLRIEGNAEVDGFADFNQSVTFNDNVTFYNPVNFEDTLDVPEIQFANPAVSGEKLLKWNNTDGTLDLGLKGGNVTLQIGQEQVIRVVNGTGADLLEAQYRAVKVIGAQGQRLQVGLAQANSDINSATTIGLVTETIANNQEGFITTEGTINKVNTTGSLQGETWSDGDVLYLSPTIPGTITNVKPITPAHLIVIGFVEYAHQNNGKIYVKVDNGYELDELHDVKITNPTDNQLLSYNATDGFWRNANGVTVKNPGVANYVTKFDSASEISPSTLIYDNGVGVGIGTTIAGEMLNIEGKIALNYGDESISIGRDTGGTGNKSVAIGPKTLSNSSGSFNVGIGTRVMEFNSTGSSNTAVGRQSMLLNTTGSENVAIGYASMHYASTGQANVAVGYKTLYENRASWYNTGIGYQALSNNNGGQYNTAVGSNSLFNNTSGEFNSAFGDKSLISNTTGGNNTAIGNSTLGSNTAGSNNTAVGLSALNDNTTGGFNTGIGLQALGSNTTGTLNTAIGWQAGRNANGATNTSSSTSVFIGAQTKSKNSSDTNQIVIGYGVVGNGSNTATIGGNALSALHVGGNGAGLVLKSPNGTSYKITVDNSGNLVTTAI